MFYLFTWILIAIQPLVVTKANAQATVPFSEQESLSALHETMKSEIDNANLAMSLSQNQALRSFAQGIINDYSSADRQSPYWQIKTQLPDQQRNAVQSLAAAGYEQGLRLSKLQGPDFDRAYFQNELEHHILMTGMLEVSMMPNMKSQDVKSFSQNCLLLFKQSLEIIRASVADSQGARIAPMYSSPNKMYVAPPRSND